MSSHSLLSSAAYQSLINSWHWNSLHCITLLLLTCYHRLFSPLRVNYIKLIGEIIEFITSSSLAHRDPALRRCYVINISSEAANRGTGPGPGNYPNSINFNRIKSSQRSQFQLNRPTNVQLQIKKKWIFFLI